MTSDNTPGTTARIISDLHVFAWIVCIRIMTLDVDSFAMVKLFSQLKNFTFQGWFSAGNTGRTPTKLTKIAALGHNVCTSSIFQHVWGISGPIFEKWFHLQKKHYRQRWSRLRSHSTVTMLSETNYRCHQFGIFKMNQLQFKNKFVYRYQITNED